MFIVAVIMGAGTLFVAGLLKLIKEADDPIQGWFYERELSK